MLLLHHKRWLRPDGAVRNWQAFEGNVIGGALPSATDGSVTARNARPELTFRWGTPAVMKTGSLLSGTSLDSIGKIKHSTVVGVCAACRLPMSCSRSSARRAGSALHDCRSVQVIQGISMVINSSMPLVPGLPGMFRA
jgi:hypothetical protein